MCADLALINGNIITMDSLQAKAQAVAIEKNRLLKVGTTEDIKALLTEKTKVVDLKGKTVVPGFIDSHIHVADFGKFLNWINLTNLNSISEMQTRLKERAQKIPKNRWIVGNGWNEIRFAEKRCPNRYDLDIASPNNPVVLYHECGRVCVVNSKALDAAKVTKETVAPLDGEIKKHHETGEPTGILWETATDLVWKTIPEPTEEEIIEATSLACEKVVEAGITTVHWIVSSLEEALSVKKLDTQNKLPVRVHVIVPANILERINELNFDSNKIDKQLGVKIFIDGSLAARTAALCQPYMDDNTTEGKLLYSQTELDKVVRKAHKTKLQLVMHAMGDKAIDMALSAIEKVLKETPREAHCHRIEHGSVLTPDLIQRIKNLGMTISVQPKCVITEFTDWSAIERLGNKRARWLYPLKTLIKNGIQIVGGSDCPMEPLNPLLGIQAAVERQYFPEEKITSNEALQMYTINAAIASCEQKNQGSIEKGKLADVTVLSGDPLTIPANDIGKIEVYMTIVDGEIVFQKLS
ncbi:MAG: amidohydrolase [Candidatus Bathyarchaeota archaeon]|nr:amidohydrolase [Candidatus Bathyarchaeum tardum]WGM90635.1 MAG: amidohydrolase [Candidatus Bathyarchaeum tardum]